MKLMLHVSPGIVRKPIVSSVILETKALINIERAKVDAGSGEIGGDVDLDNGSEVKRAFEDRGVRVVLLENPIIKDDDECVHCGACISICPTGTFRFEGSEVVADAGRCVQCASCITACPQRALRLVLK
jgi:ferredoxin